MLCFHSDRVANSPWTRGVRRGFISDRRQQRFEFRQVVQGCEIRVASQRIKVLEALVNERFQAFNGGGAELLTRLALRFVRFRILQLMDQNLQATKASKALRTEEFGVLGEFTVAESRCRLKIFRRLLALLQSSQ